MTISINYEMGTANPRLVRISTDSTLVQVTAAGWLNPKLAEQGILPSDQVEIAYAQGSSSAATAIFSVAIAAGVVTFSLAISSVILPVVDGDFAVFSGTAGAIDDRGYSPSDATKAKVVMAGSAVIVGYIAHFIDTAGTIDDTAGAVTNPGDIYAGLSGTSGALRSYPGTAANGYLALVGFNAGGAFNTTISNSLMGQSSVISIPDPGVATSEFIIADSAGTQHITSGGLQIDAGLLSSGLAAGGFAGGVDMYSTTAANGILKLRAVNAGGDFDTTISNAASVGQDQVITIPDSGAATANFLLSTGAANIIAKQEFVGIKDVLSFSAGTWTTTRIAQGNYVSRHTPGDDTAIIGIDITPAIVAAAGKGFRLDSFDVIYAIAANALDAQSVVLDRIAYADNVAVSITSIAITGVLATATQGAPYVTNVVVDVPAFDITADSKYVIELTVDNAAASEYDYYGIMLRFSQTIA